MNLRRSGSKREANTKFPSSSADGMSEDAEEATGWTRCTRVTDPLARPEGNR